MSTSDTKKELPQPPASIVIIGAGVFGISTAHALLTNPRYDATEITIVDAYAPDPKEESTFTPSRKEITASLDTSRIIRPDYTNPLYAALADQATCLFRSGWAEDIDAPEQTYTQPGLVLISTGPENGRGRRYVNSSYENVLQLAKLARDQQQQQQPESTHPAKNSGREPVVLSTSEDVEALLGCASGTLPPLTTGYINPQAGWANASAGVSAVKKRVLLLGEQRAGQGKAAFRFLSNTKVTSLVFSEDKSRVTGVVLSDGKQLSASVTILATGAWTPTLLPSLFAPRLRASGQALAYIPLHSADEVNRYAGRPTVLDMESGMFAIFPSEHYKTSGRSTGHVKIARHGWGYSYSTRVRDPLTHEETPCNLPVPSDSHEEFFTLPTEGRTACRDFTKLLLPELAEREFNLTRVCWYTDTPTSDFLIDFVPDLHGVLMATGGSGHGYKFLPVIGEKIVARLEGRLDPGLRELWMWRSDADCERLWLGEGDASRGGKRGMSWDEEVAR